MRLGCIYKRLFSKIVILGPIQGEEFALLSHLPVFRFASESIKLEYYPADRDPGLCRSGAVFGVRRRLA
jgi:hypothetical protein